MIDEWDEGEVSDLEDEYTLLGELGRGGSAVVYRARDRALHRDVAIKVVRPKFAASAEDAIARLAREARTVARLQHPNIVTVHAVKRLQDGGLALVMQLVPGRTLKQAIADDGPFEPERAEDVVRDVAEALAFAHSKGVVHRDVKPENIFLEVGTGRALLADFGIAYSSEYDSRLTMTGAAIGTPAYMAPEQIDGAPANARSDIYSLGLVAWEMLTGERPWEGEALYNVIFKQKNDQLPAIDSYRPGEVPPRLQYIVERMLQKKPNARWAGAEGLLMALNNWVVPSDWRQWEESHRRRRELERTSPRSKTPVRSPTADATVRFDRPSEGVEPSAAGSAAASTSGGGSGRMLSATTDVMAAVPDGGDAEPSWGNVPEPVRRTGLWITLSLVAAVSVGGGGFFYAKSRGAFDSRTSAVTSALNDSRAVDLPLVPTPSAPDTLHASIAPVAGAPITAADSLARHASDSIRTDSIVQAMRAQRRAARAGQLLPTDPNVIAAAGATTAVRPAAAVPEAPRVESVRSTDDLGMIAAGGRHSCAISSAKVYCWGANDRGQLGNGETESHDEPVAVSGDLDFTMVTTGNSHSCGVARGGDAYCWGSDERGQLGDATTTSRSAPVRVATNQSFRVLRAGLTHTCGLTSGGEALCWGGNDRGQLGDGTASSRSSPTTVLGSMRFVSLSAGWYHTCGIQGDGTAYCWGQNTNGELGNGTRTDSRQPVPVATSVKFTSISAGTTHTCAVSDQGDVYCWGRNNFGQLGTGGSTDQSSPTKVDGSTKFVSVSVGGVHSCARTRGGQAWCWGRNLYGQLGDGTNANHDAPTRVTGGLLFSSVNATGAHTCGTTMDGETQCWGYNVEGQLGDGSRTHHSRPTRVTLSPR